MLNRTKNMLREGKGETKILNDRAYAQRGNENHVAGPAKPTSFVYRGVMKAARLHMFAALN